MLKGEKGDTGYSITDIQMNDDYTLTITIENGMQFHTPPIRGEKGEQGTGISSVELRDDYSLLFTLDNGKTLETTAILGKEFENIRTLEASATSASKIATSASTSASESAQSASASAQSASEASISASESASASAQSATNASQSATNAQESAISANTSADTATSNATEASASATKAKECEMNAKLSETNASNSAKEAEASAVNAKASEDKAEEYANNLQNSTEAINQLKEDLVANTKEDAKTKRSLSALWDLNKGISYRFETDNSKAYKKQIPSGSKLGAVNTIGGKTIVMNQLFDYKTINSATSEGVTFTNNNDGTYTANGTSTGVAYISARYSAKEGHVYLNRSLTTVGSNVTYKSYITSTGMFDNSSFQTDYGSGAINKALISGYFYFVPLYVKKGNTVNNLKVVPQVYDLTQMFGAGNEPSTTEEFEAMFPEDYYPYNEGELMSMSVNNVVEVGKNILKCKNFSCSSFDKGYNPSLSNSYGTSINSIKPSNSVTVTQSKIEQENNGISYTNGYLCIAFNPFVLNDNYVVSFDITPSKILISRPDIAVLMNGNNPIRPANTQELQIGRTTKLYFNLNANNSKITYFEIRNSGISGVFENFQIERGTTNTAYTPYIENSYPIPHALQNLEGYGWSAGNAYNYVDFENKKFYKNVGRIDLGTCEWGLSGNASLEGLKVFISSTNAKLIKRKEQGHGENFICDKFNLVDKNESNFNAYEFMVNEKMSYKLLRFCVPSDFCTDKTDFKKKVTGTILYYELAEPIVTDISNIIGDTFQEPFNVESGGSLTFKNANGDGYQLAVPSDIQYVVSLKEVTS